MTLPLRAAAFLLLCAPIACGQKLEPGTPYVEPTPTSTASTTQAATTTTTAPATTAGTASSTSATAGTTTGTTSSTTTSATLCGTNATVIGYAATAGAVIKTNCGASNCHASKSPTMTDFASAKVAIGGGGLNAISSGSMPLGATLSPNDKCVITTWASGGFQP